ncbi:hypothetical protein Ancab_012238 [Ancistrocladus abbreviatus]
MIIHKNSIQETHYDILCVEEDASYEEIRASYRSALLNSHPDKLQTTFDMSNSSKELGDRFLKVQKAWEILSNSRSRTLYDIELQSLRNDAIITDYISLKDMVVDDAGEGLEFYYQCNCSDYFSIDDLELEEMGYQVSKDSDEIFVRTPDSMSGSIILPCGSCSLKIGLMIGGDTGVLMNDKTGKM